MRLRSRPRGRPRGHSPRCLRRRLRRPPSTRGEPLRPARTRRAEPSDSRPSTWGVACETFPSLKLLRRPTASGRMPVGRSSAGAGQSVARVYVRGYAFGNCTLGPGAAPLETLSPVSLLFLALGRACRARATRPTYLLRRHPPDAARRPATCFLVAPSPPFTPLEPPRVPPFPRPPARATRLFGLSAEAKRLIRLLGAPAPLPDRAG